MKSPLKLALPLILAASVAACAPSYKTLDSVYFNTNSTSLSKGDQAKLDVVAEKATKSRRTVVDNDLRMGEPMQLKIVGHADSVGDAAKNEALSLDRAETVKNALISKGVSPMRIRIGAEGEMETATTKGDMKNDQQGRRVDILITH